MARRRLGRREQIWTALAFFVVLFAMVSRFLPGMTGAIWWKVALAGAVCAALCIFIFDFWLRRDVVRRESAIRLLDGVAGGDLSLGAVEIAQQAQSIRMSAAIRGLVSNLERTIRRFGQLSSDVRQVAEQMAARSRVLAHAAAEQLESTEATATSVAQIDTSINAVRKGMQDLSQNAEETSTSTLEMSASIEEVSRISDTLSQFVDETASALEEMSVSINEVAANTEGFSSFATQTASSIVEMNATTTEIGRSAQNSSELARYVKDAANEGRMAVEGTVDGMRKIQQSVEEAKAALHELSARSQEIGDIIRVIDEIAGQTNLLALNAAIIAAQAGERGKGFAVVAEEIRDLSERTSVSTEEIRTLIQNVQHGVERAGEQMNLSSERVNDGVTLTASASRVLEKILELTERSTSSIAEIARATEEQSRGSAATTAAIEEVTKMVQQTATATHEQSQTAQKVVEQASTVRDYTRHLKRAMTEQETGSRSITRAMENISALVQSVLDSTSVLASESATIVKSMGVVQTGSREATFGVADLNMMSSTLSHESALLNQELDRFTLPKPAKGGRAVTSTILWQQLTLDPIYTTAAAQGFFARALHAKLVAYGEGAELRPDLAETWEVLDHGLRYRFHLRKNARFHDGRPVEGRDVYASFLRLLLPENRSPLVWVLRGIRGAEEVIAGSKRELEGVVVVDEHTVDIHLAEPMAFFLSLLTMHACGITPADDAADRERMRLRPIGAGPFHIVDAVEGERIRLARNTSYFIPDEPNLDELEFRLDLRSRGEVADAFLRGELDIAHGIPLKMVRELQRDPQYAPYLLTTIQLHTSYLSYDSSSPPFDRAEIRRAVNHAINKGRINERVFADLGVIARGLLPPGLLGYDAGLRGLDYDPDRSRSLLRHAGYPDGFSLEYRTWDTDEFTNSGQVPLMIEDLEAVGIHVNVTRHSATEARETLERPGHGLLFCGNWYADFPDSDNFMYVFFHSKSNGVSGLYYHSHDLDRQIEQARRSNDTQERSSIYKSLDEQVVREAPIVPLFHERLFVLHKPHIRGLRTSMVTPPVRYHDVWLEQE